MLLSSLQCHSEGSVPVNVLGDSDEAAGHLSLEFVLDGQVAGVRASESHGHTEPLGRPDGDIRAHLPRGLDDSEREDIGDDSHNNLVLSHFGSDLGDVSDVTQVVRVLHHVSTEFIYLRPVEVSGLVNHKLDTQSLSLGLNYLDVLWKDVLRKKELVSLSIVHIVCHEHSLRGG